MNIDAWMKKVNRKLAEYDEHLRGMLDTPGKWMYEAVNHLFHRAFGHRMSVTAYGVRTLEEIGYETGYDDEDPYYYLQPAFAKAITENTDRLERAFRSGSCELPEGIVPTNRQIKTYNRNINIKGQGADSVIRVYPGKALPDGTPDLNWGEGFDFNIKSGKHAVRLADFKIEMAATFRYGSYITIAGFDVDLRTDVDIILTRQNVDIDNVHFNGSNAFQAQKPWSHGTQYGLKLYNPNYARINWVHGFGNGPRNTDGTQKDTCGIYIESSRGGYECLISSPKLTEWHTSIRVKNPAFSVNNIPYAHEGLKIENGSLVTCFDAIVIECDTYNAPGWHILNNHMAVYRFGVKASGSQGFIKNNLIYHFGHSDAGFSAFVYLNRAASDWTVSDNKCYYQGGPEPTKDPYGIIVQGGYISFLDRFEYAVAHNIHSNYFVGKPGTNNPVAWFQDGAINSRFSNNRREFFKACVSKVAQNRIFNNSPGELLDGGVLTRVFGEQVIVTLPVLDENNDPVEPPQYEKVLAQKGDEGVDLMPYSGQRTASLVSSEGEIVLVRILAASQQGVYVEQPGERVFYNADADGKILDAQWARGREITIRDYFVSSINWADPENPVEVYSQFAGQKIYAIAAEFGQVIRLKTMIRITLVHSDDLLPLPGGNDIILMPGEYAEFENTRRGIQFISRSALPLGLEAATDLNTAGTLDAGRDWIVEDYIVPDIIPSWRVSIERYKGESGGIFERQTARHLVLPYQIARYWDNGAAAFTRWTRIDSAVLEISDENANLLPGQYYIYKTLYPGSPSFYLTEHRASETNTAYRAQTAISLTGNLTIERRRDNDVWSPWLRVAARTVSGPSAITANEYGVGYDPQGRPQLWIKDDAGSTKLITQVDDYIPTGLRNPIDFELMAYNYYITRPQRIGVNDLAYVMVHSAGSGLVEELKPLLKAYFDGIYQQKP